MAYVSGVIVGFLLVFFFFFFFFSDRIVIKLFSFKQAFLTCINLSQVKLAI